MSVVRERFTEKVIEWHEPDLGFEIIILITRFEPIGHELLEKAGWRKEEYFIFTWIDGGVNESNNDEFSLSFVTENLKTFFHQIKQREIGWGEIEDGEHYHPEDFVL